MEQLMHLLKQGGEKYYPGDEYIPGGYGVVISKEAELYIEALGKELPKAAEKTVRYELAKERVKDGVTRPHWFITISFPDDFKPQDVYDRMIELQNSGYDLKESIGVIEYYSKEKPDGGNLHFHLLSLRQKYKPCAMRKMLFERFADLSRNFVDVKFSNKTGDFKKRVGYICGKKKGGEKCKMSELDAKWRISLGFPPVSLRFPDFLVKEFVRDIDYAKHNGKGSSVLSSPE